MQLKHIWRKNLKNCGQIMSGENFNTKYFSEQAKRHNGIMLSTETKWRTGCKNNSKH